MGIVYALLALVFAGLNDLLFRVYGGRSRFLGWFVAVAGAVWTAVFCIVGVVTSTLVLDGLTLLMGIVAGTLSALANILYIAAMRNTGAGIGSTIYRLNLACVALLAFAFLDEAVTPWKIAGLVLAVITVLLMSERTPDHPHGSVFMRAIAILLLASFLRACLGISFKIASIQHVSSASFLALIGIMWIGFGIPHAVFVERDRTLSKETIRYGILSGLLICGIVLFTKLATDHGDASITVPVSQMSFLLTSPAAMLVLNEKMSPRQYIGLAIAVLSIIAFALD